MVYDKSAMEPRIQYAKTKDRTGIALAQGRELELKGLSGRQRVHAVAW